MKSPTGFLQRSGIAGPIPTLAIEALPMNATTIDRAAKSNWSNRWTAEYLLSPGYGRADRSTLQRERRRCEPIG